MNIFSNPSRLRILAGLFTNLAAGWIGAAIITFTASGFSSTEGVFTLTTDVIFATLSILTAFELEEKANL